MVYFLKAEKLHSVVLPGVKKLAEEENIGLLKLRTVMLLSLQTFLLLPEVERSLP